MKKLNRTIYKIRLEFKFSKKEWLWFGPPMSGSFFTCDVKGRYYRNE